MRLATSITNRRVIDGFRESERKMFSFKVESSQWFFTYELQKFHGISRLLCFGRYVVIRKITIMAL